MTVWISTGVVILLLATAAIWYRTATTDEQMLTVQVRQPFSCPYGSWVFPAPFDPTNLPPPTAMSARTVYQHGGASASGNAFELTVHGEPSQGAVVLRDLRVRVLSREPAPPDATYVRTCGGAGSLAKRRFVVDLDSRQPQAVPRVGDESIPGDELGTTVDFPYRVSSTEPEVFDVLAMTGGCACHWQLELDWASPEGSGTKVINLAGQPFRTTSYEGLRVHDHSPG